MAGSITKATISHKPGGIVKIKAAFTTHTDGVVTAGVIGAAFGRIVGVAYDAGDVDTGADLTLTDTDSGATIFTLGNAGTSDRFIRPTAVITDNAGAAVSAAATAVDVNRDIFVAGKLTLAVAGGGSEKSGALYLIVDEG